MSVYSMAELENPTFDPDESGTDAAFDDLPEPPLEPPLLVQQELNTSGDRIQSMRDGLRQDELEVQKKRLVDTFYKEVNRVYELRPEGRIDYNQFEIDADGKTLCWSPGDK